MSYNGKKEIFGHIKKTKMPSLNCGLIVAQNNPRRDSERKLTVPPERFLVGEQNGEIVATCMAVYEGHLGWINYLAVSPKWQHKGLANKVMSHAEKLLTGLGCPKINRQVRSSDTKMIDFYKSLGFSDDNVLSMGKRLEDDKLL